LGERQDKNPVSKVSAVPLFLLLTARRLIYGMSGGFGFIVHSVLIVRFPLNYDWLIRVAIRFFW